MKLTSFKTLAAALAGASAALTANAGASTETFQATFEFTRAQPAAEVYADFQRVARRACEPDTWISLLRSPASAIRTCEADLLDRAVAESKYPALIAYHHALTGKGEGVRD